MPKNISMLIRKLKDSKLARNLGIAFSETVTTKALNFIVILLLTRSLGPDDYGKYSYLFILITFCASFFDFGMENTAVRFSCREDQSSDGVFGLYLFMKILIIAGLLIFFMLFGNLFFGLTGKSQILPYLPFLLIGLVGESLFYLNDTYLQARQKFSLRAAINISRYCLALGGIFILKQTGFLALHSAVMIFCIPCVFMTLFLPKYLHFLQALPKALGFEKKRLKEIIQYQKWMFLNAIVQNTMSRLDFLLLSLWVGYSQLGVYNAANQLCAIISFIPYVFGKVLLPKMASLSEEEIFKYTGRLIKGTAAMSLSGTLLIPLSSWLIPQLLGKAYVAGILVFQILVMGYLLVLFSVPFEQAIYSLGKPKWLASARYLNIAICIGGYFIAIPKIGMIGAAIISSSGCLLHVMIITSLFLYLQTKRNALKTPAISPSNALLQDSI